MLTSAWRTPGRFSRGGGFAGDWIEGMNMSGSSQVVGCCMVRSQYLRTTVKTMNSIVQSFLPMKYYLMALRGKKGFFFFKEAKRSIWKHSRSQLCSEHFLIGFSCPYVVILIEKNSAFQSPEKSHQAEQREKLFMGSFKIRCGCSALDGDKWDNLVTDNGVATVIKGPSLNGSVLSNQATGRSRKMRVLSSPMYFFFSWEREK